MRAVAEKYKVKIKKNPETEDSISDSLRSAVQNYSDPEFILGAEFYTQGDVEEFFHGLIAASLIDRNPSLIFDLRKELAVHPWRCRGIDLMKETLDGDDPLNEFLTLLRSRGSWGQMIRSVFPWLTIAPKEVWDPADQLGDLIGGKGWAQIKELGGPELDQSSGGICLEEGIDPFLCKTRITEGESGRIIYGQVSAGEQRK